MLEHVSGLPAFPCWLWIILSLPTTIQSRALLTAIFLTDNSLTTKYFFVFLAKMPKNKQTFALKIFIASKYFYKTFYIHNWIQIHFLKIHSLKRSFVIKPVEVTCWLLTSIELFLSWWWHSASLTVNIYLSVRCWVSRGRDITGGPRNTPLRQGDTAQLTNQRKFNRKLAMSATDWEISSSVPLKYFPSVGPPQVPQADHITNRSSDDQPASFVRSFVIGIVLYCYRCKRGKLPN